MAKPVSTTTWATDATFTTSPDASENGATPVVDPGAGYRGQGFVPGLPFVGSYVNYVINLLCQWMVYLNGITTDSQFLGSLFAWTGTHTFTPSTAATSGITATGNTSGAGVTATGGTDAGNGVRGNGGGVNGNGVLGYGTGSGRGLYGSGGADSGDGVFGLGGAPNGKGGIFVGDGTGAGVIGRGDGTATPSTAGEGVYGVAASTSAGVKGVGGATSGAGVLGLGTGAAAPTMTKEGVYGVGGAEAAGVYAVGGVRVSGSAGHGVVGVGGTTNGSNLTTACGGIFTGGAGNSGASGILAYGGPDGGSGGRFFGVGGVGVFAQGGTSANALTVAIIDNTQPHISMSGNCGTPDDMSPNNGDIWKDSEGLNICAAGVILRFKVDGLYRNVIGGPDTLIIAY